MLAGGLCGRRRLGGALLGASGAGPTGDDMVVDDDDDMVVCHWGRRAESFSLACCKKKVMRGVRFFNER